MNLRKLFIPLFAGIMLTSAAFAQTTKPQEYFGVTGPIMFDKVAYYFSWSSHPAGNYYKQEYLAKGDKQEKFKKLVMLEILTGNAILEDIVTAKVTELKKLKETNPVVNYEIFKKNGEYLLDFLVSESSADGKNISIVERNVYRYKSVIDTNGQSCVLLFALSERAYGSDCDNFLLKLKGNRKSLNNLVAAFIIPKISIVK